MASRRRLLVGRLAGFTGLQLLSALAPLALLPLLARAAGVEGWASLVAGQSVGALVAAFGLYGWAIQGPVLVAPASDPERWDIYRSSMISRSAILAAILPLACLLSAEIAADGFVPLTLLMTCAQGVTALSPMWYGVGVGRPSTILAYDTLPRLIGVLGSAVAIASGAPLTFYPLVLILSTVGGAAAFTLKLSRQARGRTTLREKTVELGQVLSSQASAAATQIAGASYGSATVAIIGIFAATTATAEFASGDRLYRFALMAVVAVGNTFQGWGAEVPYPKSRGRMKVALGGLAGLGVLGAVSIAIAGPWATGFLFGRDLAIDGSTALWFALAFFGISLSAALGRNILIPLGRARQLLLATVVSAVVGLPCIALLSQHYGASGGAAGYAVSELSGALVLGLLLLRRSPRSRQVETVSAP